MHCDKHVCKMLIEYAQLMSTAHRVIDGTQYYSKTKNGHKIQRWLHPDPKLERELYKASHINHPSNIWIRENEQHYTWLFLMFSELSKEYTKRYGKVHASWSKLHWSLGFPPHNIVQVMFLCFTRLHATPLMCGLHEEAAIGQRAFGFCVRC